MKSHLFLWFLLGMTSLMGASCNSKSEDDGEKLEEEFDDPAAAAQYEFDLLKDRTGKTPANIRRDELEQARTIHTKQLMEGRVASHMYTMQGPANIGGRTRTVVYDV